MTQQPSMPEPAPSADKAETRRHIDSEKILCGATIVEIKHAGQQYLLRVTRENKLILTK